MTLDATTMRTFLDLTQPLLGKVELEEALRSITEAALRVVPGDAASIRVMDRSGSRVLVGALSGDPTSDERLALEAAEVVLRRAVSEARVLRVNEARREGNGSTSQAGSVLGVPLRSGGTVVGVLGVTSRAPEAFDESHELAASLLAACAAPVVERSRLERMAAVDELTLAYGSKLLLPRLREEISRSGRHGHPLALLAMDLDAFSSVNSVHGRKAGDVVLQRFADRVRASVRLSDVLFRQGGEEFALVATNTTLGAAATVAERIRRRMADRPILEDRHGTAIHQTVAIGVAGWDGAESADDLVDRAFRAVERATELGGDRVVSAMDAESAPSPETAPES